MHISEGRGFGQTLKGGKISKVSDAEWRTSWILTVVSSPSPGVTIRCFISWSVSSCWARKTPRYQFSISPPGYQNMYWWDKWWDKKKQKTTLLQNVFTLWHRGAAASTVASLQEGLRIEKPVGFRGTFWKSFMSSPPCLGSPASSHSTKTCTSSSSPPPPQSHQGKAVENVHTVPISCCYMTLQTHLMCILNLSLLHKYGI